MDTLAAGYRRLISASFVFFATCELCRACNSILAYQMISSRIKVHFSTTHYTGHQIIEIRRHKNFKSYIIFLYHMSCHGSGRRRTFTTGARIQLQGTCSPSGICGGHSVTGTGFPRNSWLFLHQYYSTSKP